uniref:Amidase domain-containing protein n=1 Tax=Euplotes crassus TaxID=5936 RepID=A0A7S3KMI9_EUPCR|mmetsp:Transcript_35321/g.34988  ORF Transcript_35321/g.34988 Transcript_35321/m.34988 type:complete len:437 (+) Transcript_35321:375-1685(+)
MGVGSRIDNISEEDAHIVAVYKNQGGIPVVKGNTPTICLSLHSTNKVWGTAKNPWNNKRSCGGSSGGDAALLTCVNFGIGSDLGGSLRCPASFCGCMSFMPTARRQISHGNETYSEIKKGDMHPMNIVLGPITKNSEDMLRLMKVYLSEEKLKMDGLDYKLRFDQSIYEDTLSCKKLRIGTITNYDEVLTLCPTGKRILQEAREHLTRLGHEVVEIEIPEFEEQCTSQGKLLVNQVCHYAGIENNIHCDDLQSVSLLVNMYNGYSIIPKTLSFFTKLVGETRASNALKLLIKLDADGFKELCKTRDRHVSQISKIFQDEKLDAILTVPMAFPAMTPEVAEEVGLAPIAARLAIYWQFPSATIPAGVVEEDEQKYEDKLFNDIITKKIRQMMQDSKGLPLGLEIIGKPFKDEQVLAIMKILEDSFKFQEKHPYPKYE